MYYRFLFAILISVFLVAPSFSFAEEAKIINTHPKAGKETPREHLGYLYGVYKKAYPNIPFKQYEDGAVMFDPAAREYAASWQKRIDDVDFERPQEVADFYAKGQKMFEQKLPSGKTLAECLPNGGKMIAANYPIFDEKTKKVLTFAMVVNKCIVDNGGKAYKVSDKKEFWPLMGYIQSLSNGMKVNIKVDTPSAVKAFNRGRDSYYTRRGQWNFACASCHIGMAGLRVRTETLSTAIGQSAHFIEFRPSKLGVLVPWTLQRRYERCQEQVRVPEEIKWKQGSEDLDYLEYFHSYLSNGLTYKMGVFRK